MPTYSAIDLEKLPPPEVVETLDFEVLLRTLVNDLQRRWPEFSADVTSEPVLKILEVAAYREMLLRARINAAAKSVMLAFAEKSDLEHLASLFNIARAEVHPAQPDAVPPIPAVMETDARLRLRTQLSLEGHSTAGPVGSYKFHALAADGQVKDVDVASPSPGEVVITVLSTEGEGVPAPALLEQVYHYLNAEERRPLTDFLRVQAPTLTLYKIEARLHIGEGPDSSVVRAAAEKAVKAYAESRHRLGADIALSGIYAALHQPGVQRAELLSPTQTLMVDHDHAAWAETITLTVVDVDSADNTVHD